MRASSRSLSRGIALTLVLAAGVAAALLSGCAAAQMGNMWRDETFQTTGMQNVLVIAMRTDPVRRRVWEDGISKGLAAYGTKATPSYQLYPNALPDTQQVISAVLTYGYDGVFVNTRPPDSQQKQIIGGYVTRESVTRQNPFTGVYYTYWQDVQVPDRVEVVRVVNFRTDVWTTKEGGRLVWSGTTNTTTGINAVVVQNQIDKLILPEMSKSGIVPAKSKQ